MPYIPAVLHGTAFIRPAAQLAGAALFYLVATSLTHTVALRAARPHVLDYATLLVAIGSLTVLECLAPCGESRRRSSPSTVGRRHRTPLSTYYYFFPSGCYPACSSGGRGFGTACATAARPPPGVMTPSRVDGVIACAGGRKQANVAKCHPTPSSPVLVRGWRLKATWASVVLSFTPFGAVDPRGACSCVQVSTLEARRDKSADGLQGTVG